MKTQEPGRKGEHKYNSDAEKELFETVYNWGKYGIVVDDTCDTFRRLLDAVENKAISDNRRWGNT